MVMLNDLFGADLNVIEDYSEGLAPFELESDELGQYGGEGSISFEAAPAIRFDTPEAKAALRAALSSSGALKTPEAQAAMRAASSSGTVTVKPSASPTYRAAIAAELKRRRQLERAGRPTGSPVDRAVQRSSGRTAAQDIAYKKAIALELKRRRLIAADLKRRRGGRTPAQDRAYKAAIAKELKRRRQAAASAPKAAPIQFKTAAQKAALSKALREPEGKAALAKALRAAKPAPKAATPAPIAKTPAIAFTSEADKEALRVALHESGALRTPEARKAMAADKLKRAFAEDPAAMAELREALRAPEAKKAMSQYMRDMPISTSHPQAYRTLVANGGVGGTAAMRLLVEIRDVVRKLNARQLATSEHNVIENTQAYRQKVLDDLRRIMVA